ncbi:PAS domain S-box-containing protein [Pedobacter sp. CG_S7]|uniref:PAS domain S-box protein n=1 Tax=Pedobacter sp. CG_S7 TaxID=3143930 RepID=UPI003391782F
MVRKIRIIHLEASLADAAEVNKVLSRSKLDFELLVVETKEKFIVAIKEFLPDIILAAIHLPSFDFLDELSALCKTGNSIPFLIVTDDLSDEFVAKIFEKGAADYLIKDRLSRLPFAIQNSLQKFQLEQEKNGFRAIIDNDEDMIVILNSTFLPIFTSQAVQRILGYTAAEAIKISRDGLIHPVDKVEADRILAQCFAAPGKAMEKQVCRFKHKNGSWKWIESTITNRLNDANINGIVANCRDITEWKLAEQKLVSSNKALKQTLNELEKIMISSFDIICTIDVKGVIVNINETVMVTLGYTPAELIGKNLIDFVIPEDVESTIEVNQDVIKGNPVTIFENRCVHKDGRIIPLLWSARYDQTANLIYARAKDASEMKQLEKSFEAERKRFNDLFRQAPTSIGILIGPDHVFKLANPLYLQLIGKIDIIGKSVKEVLPLITDQGFLEMLDEVYLTGKTINAYEKLATIYDEATAKLKNIYINLSYQPYRDAEDNIQGIFFFIVDVTKEVEARKIIEESESRYRQIVETSQEGIWLLDENSKTTFVNKKMCAILEYSPEEMHGRSIYCFIGQEERVVPGQLDVKFTSKSGNIILASASSNYLFDDSDNFKGTLTMVSDITEKKKLADLLSKANSLARIGSYEFNLLTKKLYWSAITKEIHEVDVDYIPTLEQMFDFCKTEKRKKAVEAAFNNAISTGDSIDLEFEIITSKGNERWVRVIGEPEVLNGQIIKFYGSLQDIDGRKRAEINDLKAFEEKKTVLESIGDAFFTVDENWVVTYWNKHAEKLLDIAKGDIIGECLWTIFADPKASPFYIPFHKAVQEDAIKDFEAYYDKPDCWFEVTAYPSANGLSVYLRDVTERKLANLRVLELNENLEKYTKELVISNKELEQFSYIISHNLRSPVANIMGLVEVLKDDSHTPEVQQQLYGSLSVSVKLLDETIIDLNTILKVKNEINEKMETVNFEAIIDNIRLSIQNVFRESQVSIATDFNEVAEYFTLKSYMQSIFFNFISNSIKYRQLNTRPLIEIKTSCVNGELVIYYKDNGLGIDLDKKGEQVFGLYKRFHDHVEGKGMGLFMVKTQVETLRGKITITSEVNNGTAFTLVFPLT